MTTVIGIKDCVKTLRSLDKGINRCGDTFKLVDLSEAVNLNCDAYIQTNLLKPKHYHANKSQGYQFIQQSKKPFIVSESASFRKYPQYARLGWYSYKWTDGLFGNENSSDDRWNKFVKDTNIRIKEWNSPGDNILIMGQKEGDSSLLELYKTYQGFYDWVDDIVQKIRLYSDRKIVLRPHPRNLRHGESCANKLARKYGNIEVSKNVASDVTDQGGDGLDRDLKNSYCVITYNSLSSIEAICEGIPTYAFENGSMIWPIAHKDISSIEKLNYNVDITQWCNDIAYTQWTATENRKGESWKHLKPLMFGE